MDWIRRGEKNDYQAKVRHNTTEREVQVTERQARTEMKEIIDMREIMEMG